MPRPKKSPEDKFELIPQEFRDTIRACDREQIKLHIAQVTLDQLELMLVQKEDQHYQELKEQFKEAGAIYREGTKMNGLKIAFAKQVLEDKGG